MTRLWARYILIGLSLYCIFLLVFAPAAWVGAGVARLSDGFVSLRDLRGTLWSGDATLTDSVTRQDLGRVHWRISPAWLLIGQIGATIELSGPQTMISASIRAAFGRVKIRLIEANFTPAFAAMLYPSLSLADPGGHIELRAKDLSVTRSAIDGDAHLVWRGAAVNMSDIRPLGDYELKLSGKSRKVDITLLTRAGPLDLHGRGSWLPFDSGRIEFSGMARAISRKAELAPLLMALDSQGAGEARLTIRTAFALR